MSTRFRNSNYRNHILNRFPNRESETLPYASSPWSYSPLYKLYFNGPD